MTLFFTLLPIYLFGNLHCAGMCGPLVMLLAKHPQRWHYFIGRLLSFTLAGVLSAEIGMLFFLTLNHYHIPALFSLSFGIGILVIGFCGLFRLPYPGRDWLAQKTARLSAHLAQLNSPFWMGLATPLLPCGQTLIVFSACALNGSALAGLFNGFCFALLTSPSLIASMYTLSFFKRLKGSYHLILGIATLVIGTLALLRGIADLNVISHLIINPNAPDPFHIVLY